MNSYEEKLQEIMNKSTENPIMTLKQSIEGSQYPSGSEPSLIHPFNTSTVKIRDNGCIDIFVDTNTGIRLDPNLMNISIVTEGMRSHLGYLKEWIQLTKETYIGGNSIKVVGGNIYIEVGGNATAIVKGNLTANIGGNVKIDNGGTVQWNSDGDMYFSAPNYHFK